MSWLYRSWRVSQSLKSFFPLVVSVNCRPFCFNKAFYLRCYVITQILSVGLHLPAFDRDEWKPECSVSVCWFTKPAYAWPAGWPVQRVSFFNGIARDRVRCCGSAPNSLVQLLQNSPSWPFLLHITVNLAAVSVKCDCSSYSASQTLSSWQV